MKRFWGAILVTASGVLFGVEAVLTTFATDQGMPLGMFLVVRSIASAAALAMLARITKKKLLVQRSLRRKACFYMLLGPVMTNVLLAVSYRFIPTGAAGAILFRYPVLVMLGGLLFFREKPPKIAVACLAAVIAGLILFFEPGSRLQMKGIIPALLSSYTWSFYILSVAKSDLRETDSHQLVFLAVMLEAVIGMAMALFTSTEDGWRMNVPASAWAAGVCVGFFVAIMALIFFQEGVRCIGPDAASVLSVFEPVSTLLLSWAFLKEALTERQLMACTVIILAVLALMISEFIRGKKLKLKGER